MLKTSVHKRCTKSILHHFAALPSVSSVNFSQIFDLEHFKGSNFPRCHARTRPQHPSDSDHPSQTECWGLDRHLLSDTCYLTLTYAYVFTIPF